ncbi:PAS domain-containing protein [Magnetococcus sp. PR-3]|uniref:PAS domain-containing protein n=1 Tax=Magnetococcus sp. PR-3 TaxID=3120355 RepID=UPI002FCE5E3A
MSALLGGGIISGITYLLFLRPISEACRSCEQSLKSMQQDEQLLAQVRAAQEELKVSEERLALAMKGADFGLWDWDVAHEKLFFSRRWKGMLGYNTQELENTYETWSERVHPDDLYQAERVIRQTLTGEGSDYTCEFRMRHKQGHYVDILSCGHLLRDEEGQPLRMVGTHIDLTKRRASERALADYSRRLKLAAKAGGIGVWQWDVVTNTLSWDERMFSLYRVAQESFGAEYTVWQKSVLIEDLSRVEAELQQAINGGVDFNTVFRIRWPNGDIRYIQAAAVVVRDEENNPLQMVGVNWDISEQKQNEDTLQEYTRRLELAARAGGLGVWLLNLKNQDLSWDDRLFAMYQIPKEKFSGIYEAWQQAVLPEDRERAEAELQAAVDGGAAFDTQFRVRWPDGSIRTIKASAVVVYDEHNQPERMVGVNWDITEQKEQEQQILDAMHQAEKANLAKSEFLAHMSHDLRTPINAILGMAEMLQLANLTTDELSYLQVLSRSGEVLLNLVNDILDISKIEAGELVLEPARVDIQQLAREALAMVEVQARTKGVSISLNWDQHLPKHVLVDGQRLSQVLHNLLGNAVKFTDKGSVSLGVSQPSDGCVLFEVCDCGVGISPADQQRIFAPFAQVLEGAGAARSGSGLGLTICTNLVEAMGGTMQLESKVGQGSRFFFSLALPQADLDKPSSLAPTNNQAYVQPKIASNKHLRILLVDDSLDNRLLIEAFLKHSGHVLQCAEDGLKGYEMMISHHYDLILMDIQMPRLDGYGSVEKIRAWEARQPNRKPIPIIALTANAMRQDRDRALANGFDDYLTKPIRKKSLLAALQSYTVG